MRIFEKLWSRPRRVTRLTQDSVEQNLKAWSIFTANNAETGQQAIFRARVSRPARPDVGTLTTAIIIKWPYAPSDGMPEHEENQRQLKFERALDPLACENDNSELVHVSTGMGLKEWIYYARSRDLFMERFNELLANHEPFPLAIEFYDDPEWQVWADMVKDLKVRGA